MTTYYVPTVYYNPEKTHIVSLGVTAFLPFTMLEAIGAAIISREEVVYRIQRNDIFFTAYEHGSSGFSVGSRVIIDRVNGVNYLKTIPNDVEMDNLGDLITFK